MGAVSEHGPGDPNDQETVAKDPSNELPNEGVPNEGVPNEQKDGQPEEHESKNRRSSNRATGAAWFDKVGSGEYGVVYEVSPEFAAAHGLDVGYPLVCKVIPHYSPDSVAVMHDSAILEILCSKYLHETGFDSPGRKSVV